MSAAETYATALAVNADEPTWLQAYRAAAAARLAETGFPTRRDEDWKYVRLGVFADEALPIGGSASAAAAHVQAATLGNELARIVFVGGVYDASLSTIGALPDGVRVQRLAEAWDRAQDLLPAADTLAGFEALRGAFAQDGVVVELEPDVELDQPIHVIHVGSAGSASATSHFVRVGGHTKVQFVESYVGDGGRYLGCTGTVVRMGDGSRVDHVRIQDDHVEAAHIATDDVCVPRDATYRAFNLSIGAALSRVGAEVRVEGPGAHTDAAALYMPGDGQTIDNHTCIDHRAPNCTADQLYKGILDGSGHGVFNGKVFVQQAAQQTNANQLNQNLMLSRDARIDTKPQLEIFADDVRCTHGATIGQIEPEELFYMMARAIPADVARRMIVRGFADEVLERVEDDATRNRLAELVDRRLAG